MQLSIADRVFRTPFIELRKEWTKARRKLASGPGGVEPLGRGVD